MLHASDILSCTLPFTILTPTYALRKLLSILLIYPVAVAVGALQMTYEPVFFIFLGPYLSFGKVLGKPALSLKKALGG